jgi:hypothetical protein
MIRVNVQKLKCRKVLLQSVVDTAGRNHAFLVCLVDQLVERAI